MTVSFPVSPEENPRERLRRLLKSEEEKQGKDVPGQEKPEDETAQPVETDGGEEKAVSLEKSEDLQSATPTETPPSEAPRAWSPDTQDQPVDQERPAQFAIPAEQGTTPPSTSSRTSPPPPPPLGETPHTPPPALGTMGMPLPPRGDEAEINAARPEKTPPSGQPVTSSQPPSITHRPSTDSSPDQTAPKKPAPVSRPVQTPPGKVPSTSVYPSASGNRAQAETRKQSQTTGYQRPAPNKIQPTLAQPYPPTTYQPQAYTNTSNSRNSRANIRKGLGCAARMIIIGIFGFTVVCLCLASFMIYEYYTISQKLPPVDNLREKTSTFETTYIRDRNGDLLYEVLDPTAGRRTYVTLDKISPYFLAAVIATEDKNYYYHGGFDPLAILRAFWQNISSGETVSGASTITQQLVRILFLSAEERGQRTYIRKVREALLAAEVTRRYSKDEILELYLNEIYFGKMAYGIEAASQTYFGISANQLTLGQAAFLAGLPQAPALYDVYTNRAAALERQRQVLQLIWTLAVERGGCITVYIGGASQDVCINAETLRAAYDQIQNYQFQTTDVQMRFPHWVIYITQQLEAQYGSETIYRSGFNVYTTIDPTLQEAAEKLVKQQVANLTANHATDGALVAINPVNGEILAMVGSADFNDKVNSGEVNMAISPRQPGSAIKPVNYLAAFEKGWTPATLIWDVPTSFTPSGDPNDPVGLIYTPTNYDGRFHGPVTVRTALANSYNIPAVKTLQFVGIYSDPNNPGQGGMIAMAKRLGIDSLTGPDYGLALTLGGGEVSPLELTGAYAVIANGGVKVPLVSITRILDHTGNVVYEYKQPQGAQVIRPEHAYLISSILSDNEARAPMFGRNSPLALPFQAAAKTGTTTSFKDNWTIGYTPDLAVGVWVGNADNTPMENTTGLTGAAPIWHDFMITAIDQLKGGNPTPFYRPGDIIDRIICAISGTEPSPSCPSQRSEVFAADQPPLPASQDLWAAAKVDTWTNLRASSACGNFTKDVDVINVTDTWARAWLTQNDQGRAWAKDMGFSTPLTFAPDRDCTASDPRPLLSFNSPGDGQTILTSPLDIFGQVDATSNFSSYRLEWGQGDKPDTWKKLDERNTPVKQVEKLFTWDLLTGNDGSAVPAGLVTLRLYMQSTSNTYAELQLHINIGVPTLTPTVSPSPTPTVTGTSTPVPTVTPTVTPLPTNTLVPTNTPLPPTPTETLTPEATTTGSTP